jgi:hypothetical protein
MLLIFPCVKLHCSISGLLSDLIQLSPANQELQTKLRPTNLLKQRACVRLQAKQSRHDSLAEDIQCSFTHRKINRIRAVLRVTAQLPVCGLGFGT